MGLNFVNGEDGYYPKSFLEMFKLGEAVRGQSNSSTFAFDVNSNYFVCPGTGTQSGNMFNVDEWTDYIYI
jgi:hypothetical protein